MFILGAGRAGRGLAVAMKAAGLDVVGVHGRRARDDSPPTTSGPLPAAVTQATTVLVAVRDAQLSSALDELGAAGLRAGAVVLHASGAVDPRAALDRLRAGGHPAGTFHPLVPFVAPSAAPALLRGAWVGVEGDPEAVHIARALAERMGAHVLAIPADHRAAYHAAATMAGNFPVVLMAVSSEVLTDAGVEPTAARAAVLHLMAAALANLAGADAQIALTGPVSRGDSGTVARHLEVLRGDRDAARVYRVLTRSAVPLAARAGVDPQELRRIIESLDVNSSR